MGLNQYHAQKMKLLHDLKIIKASNNFVVLKLKIENWNKNWINKKAVLLIKMKD